MRGVVTRGRGDQGEGVMREGVMRGREETLGLSWIQLPPITSL